MKRGKWLFTSVLAILFSGLAAMAQSVPFGVNYQAVARDGYGNEIKNSKIDVKFSIISDNQDGQVVYEEIHADVPTSPYGVFSIIIGRGTPVVNGKSFSSFSQIRWDSAPHYVKVSVKFSNYNNYIEMGTMQFLAVPYALYAQKSLEPGPQGPKGDPGDPASDNQKLSFDGKNLTISENGNTVNLSTLNVAHNLTILGDTLSIYGGNKVGLPNYMQDLTLDVNNILKISKNGSATPINLSKYLDNTDNQTLSFDSGTNRVSIAGGNYVDLSKFYQQLNYNSSTNKLSISNIAGEIDLTPLKNDADADPANEIQSLTFDKNSGNLAISSGNAVSLNNPIGFKAKRTVNQTGLTLGTTYPFVNSDVEFDEGTDYDSGSGTFTAPLAGIYTFLVIYKADGSGSGRVLSILKNSSVYEVLGPDILAGTELTRWVVMKLNQGETVSLTINTGMSQYSGTGSFVGYRNN
jgi:hypothetical protein